jgi:predicted lysophospholipase L1 biosynthesis ABC-type transport system permease subunit
VSGFEGLPQVSQVAQTIQLSVAPVFLLAGIGGFLNVCASRLARVVDRARAVEALVLKTRGKEHDRLIDEMHLLDKRITVVNVAIFLSVLSAVLICLVVILLFASELVDAHFGTLIALLFIASMIALAVGFATFIYETRLGSRAVHIRNEILYHQAEEEELR